MLKHNAKKLLTSILLIAMLFLICSVALAENQELALKAGMTKSEFKLMNPLV